MITFVYPRESGKNKQNSPYCNLKGTAALKFRFLLLSHRSISAIGKRAIRAVNGPKIGKKTLRLPNDIWVVLHLDRGLIEDGKK